MCNNFFNSDKDMNKELLKKCIAAIHDKKATGFSFVNSLMSVLMEHNAELCISNIVTIWKVSFSSEYIKYFYYYSNNQQINLDNLDISALCECDSVMSSESTEFDAFCKRQDLINRRIVAIPINQYSSDCSLLPTRGVMILFSHDSELNISSEHLTLLHSLLNMREPKTFTSRNVVTALKKLTSKTQPDELSYLKCYKYVGESLDVISNKSESNYYDSGLRHYSLWQHTVDEEGYPVLTKEFNRNTYKGTPHDCTNICLNNKDSYLHPHFLFDTIKQNPIDNNMDVTLIKCISYNEARESFMDEDYFKKILELSEENCTIVVVATGKGLSCMVSCLYIKNIVYSVFISKELILHYIQEISRRIRKENIRTQNLLLDELMIASFMNSEERDFYSKASDEFKRANDAKECLIYMRDESHRLKLKSETNSHSDFEDIDSISLPERFLDDNKFVNWFNQYDFNNELTEKYVIYPFHSSGSVQSAMAIPITSKGDVYGLIVLINKDHTPSSQCVFYHNTFIIDSYAITSFCGLFLIQYQQLQNSIISRNYLLSKLRHEIPNNSEAIRFSIQNIKSCLEEPDIKRSYIYAVLNSILLNNSRTYLLANFISTVDFKLEKFAEDRTQVSLNRFLNSYIDIFRTEGAYKNVGVYFKMEDEDTTLFVSNYYLLAIVNVITNAIRYSAEGTLVYIEVYEDRLTVTDVGIPIKKDDMKHIFKEGFRSDEAKAKCEKGMGYGLYLSKKILEAHHSRIEPECVYLFNENYYLQKAICEYLHRIPDNKRNRFIYDGLEVFNYSMADELYNRIKNNSNHVDLDMKFYNYPKMDMMQEWLDYVKKGNLVFLDMEDEFFNKEVYKVSFTIYF